MPTIRPSSPEPDPEPQPNSRPSKRRPARRHARHLPTWAGAACAGARCSLAALAGAAALGLAAWFARFVSAALARDDWVGTTTLVLLLLSPPSPR